MHNAHTKRRDMHKCIRAGGDPVEPATGWKLRYKVDLYVTSVAGASTPVHCSDISCCKMGRLDEFQKYPQLESQSEAIPAIIFSMTVYVHKGNLKRLNL